jgi:hypothetical protein
MPNEPSPNSLGLDFNNLQVHEPEAQQTPESPLKGDEGEKGANSNYISSLPQSSDVDEHLKQSDDNTATEPKEKKKSYINPERVKTGGNQRVSWLLLPIYSIQR